VNIVVSVAVSERREGGVKYLSEIAQWKRTGTVKEKEPPATSAGAEGKGFALRTIASAFWSRAEEPEVPAR
jgi:hypothetical protein